MSDSLVDEAPNGAHEAPDNAHCVGTVYAENDDHTLLPGPEDHFHAPGTSTSVGPDELAMQQGMIVPTDEHGYDEESAAQAADFAAAYGYFQAPGGITWFDPATGTQSQMQYSQEMIQAQLQQYYGNMSSYDSFAGRQAFSRGRNAYSLGRRIRGLDDDDCYDGLVDATTARQKPLDDFDRYLLTCNDERLVERLQHYKDKIELNFDHTSGEDNAARVAMADESEANNGWVTEVARRLPMFICHISDCEFKTTNTGAMAEHLDVSTQKHCPDCSRIFHTDTQLDKHREANHVAKDIDENLCELCGVHVKTKKSLANHQRIIHFYCPTCRIKFEEHNNLVDHIRDAHKSDGIFTCTTCNEGFFSKSRLLTHQSHSHGQKSNYGTCPYCDKELNMASMRVHIQRLHEKRKNFKCQHCRYESYDTYMMKEHMRRHLGEYIYQCDYCQFKAVKKYQLDSHVRRHTGEKPFKCTQCNYSSAWNVQLKQHMKIHDSMVPSLMCNICNIAFRDHRALRTHNRVTHKDIYRAVYPYKLGSGQNTSQLMTMSGVPVDMSNGQAFSMDQEGLESAEQSNEPTTIDVNVNVGGPQVKVDADDECDGNVGGNDDDHINDSGIPPANELLPKYDMEAAQMPSVQGMMTSVEGNDMAGCSQYMMELSSTLPGIFGADPNCQEYIYSPQNAMYQISRCHSDQKPYKTRKICRKVRIVPKADKDVSSMDFLAL